MPSDALNLLAIGMSVESVAEALSHRGSRMPTVPVDEVLDALDHAAALLRDEPLLPAVEAGFLRAAFALPHVMYRSHQGRGLRIGSADIGVLRSDALQLIGELRSTGRAPQTFEDTSTAARSSLALRFAERLLLQEEGLTALRAAASDGESVHANLEDFDRRIVDMRLLYDGRVVTLDRRIERWRSVGEWLDRGSTSLLYEEYEAGLGGREHLEEVLTLLSHRARHQLEPAIRIIDEHFLLATRSLVSSIRPQTPWVPQRWWWYRVPSEPGDAFSERLAAVAPAAARELAG